MTRKYYRNTKHIISQFDYRVRQHNIHGYIHRTALVSYPHMDISMDISMDIHIHVVREMRYTN